MTDNVKHETRLAAAAGARGRLLSPPPTACAGALQPAAVLTGGARQ